MATVSSSHKGAVEEDVMVARTTLLGRDNPSRLDRGTRIHPPVRPTPYYDLLVFGISSLPLGHRNDLPPGSGPHGSIC